jgi:hypothetical protein
MLYDEISILYFEKSQLEGGSNFEGRDRNIN